MWGWEGASEITWRWDFKKICSLLELGQVADPRRRSIVGNVHWCRSRESPVGVLLANKLNPSPHYAAAATKSNQILGFILRDIVSRDRDMIIPAHSVKESISISNEGLFCCRIEEGNDKETHSHGWKLIRERFRLDIKRSSKPVVWHWLMKLLLTKCGNKCCKEI